MNKINLEYEINSKFATKKKVRLKVFFSDRDGVCDTLEGKVKYKCGDAIITGTKGDKWPIELAKFNKTYTSHKSTTKGQDGFYFKKKIQVLAMQINRDFSISRSPDKDRLCGKAGDWLIQYSIGDYGIVAQEIFAEIYEIANK